MEELDRVINGLKVTGGYLDMKSYTDNIAFNLIPHIKDAVELLKEQDEQKKQILKAVWDVLHEGVSTDTVDDQDWVYEQIRNRVDKMY